MVLSFFGNLSGEQWAAWAQALGSILAIGGSFWLARSFQIDELKRLEISHQKQVELAVKLRNEEIHHAAKVARRRQYQLWAVANAAATLLYKSSARTQQRAAELSHSQLKQVIQITLSAPLKVIQDFPVYELDDATTAIALMGLAQQYAGVINVFAIDENATPDTLTHLISAAERVIQETQNLMGHFETAGLK